MDSGSASGMHGLQLPGLWLRKLLRRYMSGPDRLAYFQASKLTAAAVLQHSDRMHEAQAEDAVYNDDHRRRQHRLRPARSEGYSVTLTINAHQEQGASKQQLQARWRALQNILSAAAGASIQVVLQHDISKTWTFLPGRQITTLTLTDMHLPAGLEALLPLQQCSHLHTLQISNVGWDQQQGFSASALSEQQRAAFHAPSLTHMVVIGFDAWGGLQACGQLLGTQVKHLTYQLGATRQNFQPIRQTVQRTLLPAFSTPPTFTAVTHLQTEGLISDTLLDDLVALPNLRHVTAAGLQLERSHLTQRLNWQHLTLCGTHLFIFTGALLVGAQHVRLQDIRGITLWGSLETWPDEAESLDTQLSSHPSFQCVPVNYRNGIPSFQMLTPCASGLVSNCANALTQGPAVLGLWMRGSNSWELGPISHALPGLSKKVTFLALACLLHPQDLSETWVEQQKQRMQQVAVALPPHITSVWLLSGNCDSQVACVWASVLIPALAASRPHVQVLVSQVPRDRTGWPPEQLVQLSKTHPGRVYTFRHGMAVKLEDVI